MLHEGIWFHNVCELERKEQQPGVRLQRFPAAIRQALTEKGRTKAMQASGCELRFVTDARYVQVTLSVQESGCRALVFRGDFMHGAYELTAGALTTLRLEQPERFPEVEPVVLANRAFAPHVWRIYLERCVVSFFEIEAFGFEVRPPRAEEVPRLTLMAYGSSITQGAGALSNYNGYIHQAARRLHVDALNLGLSGSCFCEKELSDHLVSRQDWDLAFLELGVNMRGELPVEQFADRTAYLLDRLLARHPEKPVFLTTIYPNRATYYRNSAHIHAEHEQLYNEALRSYVKAKRHGKLHLIEGDRMMTDFTSLTSDLIHPSDYGHMRMGECMANLLQPVVNDLLNPTINRNEGEYV